MSFGPRAPAWSKRRGPSPYWRWRSGERSGCFLAAGLGRRRCRFLRQPAVTPQRRASPRRPLEFGFPGLSLHFEYFRQPLVGQRILRRERWRCASVAPGLPQAFSAFPAGPRADSGIPKSGPPVRSICAGAPPPVPGLCRPPAAPCRKETGGDIAAAGPRQRSRMPEVISGSHLVFRSSNCPRNV